MWSWVRFPQTAFSYILFSFQNLPKPLPLSIISFSYLFLLKLILSLSAMASLLNPPFSLPNSLSSPSILLSLSPPFLKFHPQTKQPLKKRANFLSLCTSYEVGGGYPDSENAVRDKTSHDKFNQKLETSEYDAILKGGDQVTSVLQEMITLVSALSPFLPFCYILKYLLIFRYFIFYTFFFFLCVFD